MGRYVDFESHNTRSPHESRYDLIPPVEFGLYNKYKEINFEPMSEKRISGYGDSFKMTLSLTPEKVKKVIKSCQNLLRSHCLVLATVQTVEPANIFSTTTNCVSEKKMNYQY